MFNSKKKQMIAGMAAYNESLEEYEIDYWLPGDEYTRTEARMTTVKAQTRKAAQEIALTKLEKEHGTDEIGIECIQVIGPEK